MVRRWGWCVLALAAGLASCSSDDFGAVGGGLPLDVGQDSLLVALDPPVVPLQELTAVPDTDQEFEAREVLYLGNRTEGAWRATPLLRFDFSAGLPDTLDVADVKNFQLELAMLADDVAKGINRTVQLYELADTLSAQSADVAAVQDLLGADLGEISIDNSSRFDIPLPESVLATWLNDASHNGLAIFDLTASDAVGDTVSNLVGFAANEFTRFGSRLDAIFVGETATPEIVIEFDGGEFVAFPVLLDLTHFERTVSGSADLTMGSHFPSRTWFRFDLEGSGVPGNATVNEALLTLQMRPGTSLGDFLLTLAAYEATEDQATTLDADDLDRVLRSAGSILASNQDTLLIDVTEFVQRATNLVVGSDVGLLLAFDNELFDLAVADFFGSDADEALRPRLDISFTAPADFWR